MAVAHSQEQEGLDFEWFFHSEFDRLFQTLLLVVGDRPEAEELVQEGMARVYERWDRVRRADSPTAYLYRTAFNLNRTRLRRLGVRIRKAHLLHRTEADPGQDPARIAELRNDVLEALAALPPSQREALVLVDWLGMDAEELGRVLGIEAASVRGRLHRARESVVGPRRGAR